MQQQINVRLTPARKQKFREFCVTHSIGMQHVLLASVEALIECDRSREFLPFYQPIITRAKQLRAEAMEP
jgi:hypothetical protein